MYPLLAATFAQRTGRTPSIAHLIFSRSTSTISFGAPRGFLDDDDSDDDSPLSSILSRAFGGGPFLAPIMRPLHLREPIVPSRSYASNSNDRTAGNRAENPLEIEDDSDDDDDDDNDDVVEIIEG
jgi:hypothetical protein